MWKQIKDWCYTDKIETVPFMPDELNKDITNALAHYCEICDRGFTTRGGTKNHKRLKHKNVDNK